MYNVRFQPDFKDPTVLSLIDDRLACVYDPEAVKENFDKNRRHITLQVSDIVGIPNELKKAKPAEIDKLNETVGVDVFGLPGLADIRAYNLPQDADSTTHSGFLVSTDAMVTLGDGNIVHIIRDMDYAPAPGAASFPGGVTDNDPTTCLLKELNEEIFAIRLHPEKVGFYQVALVNLNGETGISEDEKLQRVREALGRDKTRAAMLAAGINPDDVKDIEIVQVAAESDPDFAGQLYSTEFNSDSKKNVVSDQLFLPYDHRDDSTLVMIAPLVIPELNGTDWKFFDGEIFGREILVTTPTKLKEERNPPMQRTYVDVLSKLGYSMRDMPEKELKEPLQAVRRDSHTEMWKKYTTVPTV